MINLEVIPISLDILLTSEILIKMDILSPPPVHSGSEHEWASGGRKASPRLFVI
jgi:hypothetical protein